MSDAQQGFTATHQVPAAGLDAWSEADATKPPAARLDAGLPVQLLRHWGDWAEIRCSNGWTAWVGRSELPTATPATGPVVTPSSSALAGVKFSPALLGGVIAVVGCVLPWVRGTGESENGFGISVQFLVDYKTTSTGGLSVGLLVLAAAVGGGACLYLPGVDKIRRGCGWVAVLLPTMYVGQLQRLVSDPALEGTGLSVFDLVGFGVLVTIGGGLLLALGPAARDQ